MTTTVEGRERYPVNVRYMRDFRSDLGPWAESWYRHPEDRRQIPLSQLATIRTVNGPSMIRDEDGLLTGYVYVDIAGRDPNSYIEEAGRLLREKMKLPAGYAISWSGEYEGMQRVKERLTVVLPADALSDPAPALPEYPVASPRP